MFSDHYKRDELHILEEEKKKTAVLVGPVEDISLSPVPLGEPFSSK
jgi:hypothetical protein